MPGEKPQGGFAFTGLEYPMGHGKLLAVPHLELGAAERLVLFGPNGAGKSTLLRVLAGTLGKPLPGPPTAYLPQRPYMFRGSGLRNLHLGVTPDRAPIVETLAERLGVGDILPRPARTMSGGERQRIALARVLSTGAPLVLLDEPLAPLDVRDRASVAMTIASALVGRSAIVVTHDRDSAAVLGERIAVMIGGVIRQQGPIGEVFSLPADDEVAAVVGTGNVIGGTVTERDDPLVAVDCSGATVWALGDQAPGSAVKVMFGAEAVTVYTGEVPLGSARNHWSGTVETVRETGRLAELLVDVGPTVAVLITPGSLEALQVTNGDSVTLSVKATAIRAHLVAGPGDGEQTGEQTGEPAGESV